MNNKSKKIKFKHLFIVCSMLIIALLATGCGCSVPTHSPDSNISGENNQQLIQFCINNIQSGSTGTQASNILNSGMYFENPANSFIPNRDEKTFNKIAFDVENGNYLASPKSNDPYKSFWSQRFRKTTNNQNLLLFSRMGFIYNIHYDDNNSLNNLKDVGKKPSYNVDTKNRVGILALGGQVDKDSNDNKYKWNKFNENGLNNYIDLGIFVNGAQPLNDQTNSANFAYIIRFVLNSSLFYNPSSTGSSLNLPGNSQNSTGNLLGQQRKDQDLNVLKNVEELSNIYFANGDLTNNYFLYYGLVAVISI